MNPYLDKLQAYPFEKLNKLKAGLTPNEKLPHIAWSIGEPKHPAPEFVLHTLRENLDKVARYPTTKGLPELRQSIANWLQRRFSLTENSLCLEKNILPVNGTREALFAIAQTLVKPQSQALVMMPNPFYQIYEGAALLAGAEPCYLACHENNGYRPDLSSVTEAQWQRCQLFYICSPNNPTGSIYTQEDYEHLLSLADRYDFVIASDECYSEIYPVNAKPPTGLLEVCRALGRDDFKRCIVFHSLSKRSNLPGLRSGFVAGDAQIIQAFLSYRTYHGCAMPLPTQIASIEAWNDEKHVVENRVLYTEKFTQVADILQDVWPLQVPEAGFNFWAKTPIDDEVFTQGLFEQQHVTVLPGSYLSRSLGNQDNPGKGYVRMALVAPVAECIEAAQRTKHYLSTL